MQRSSVLACSRALGLFAGLAFVVGVVLLDSGEARGQGESVALSAGWSNVAYGGELLPVAEALTDAGAVVVSVWHWDADGQIWGAWFAGAPVASTLVVLEPGEAYWIRAREAVLWSPRASVTFQTARVRVETAVGVSFLLDVELADTSSRRWRGLMFRQELAASAGMLFLFASDTQGGFWMQNTFVPLSIAFIDPDGLIVDILDMEPLTTTTHTPSAPYRWALETNQGWFDDGGVGVGDRVSLTGR
ncbi:MAG TPA: DUF192 domain-containing protein [Dehalococcoidia bacterium]|nr:DUF192 domain-containing protein [Dehalococcoidia bacterium]